MANSNAYMNDYMKRRYHERKLEAISLLGGRCFNCSSTRNLELDHIDRKLKNFSLSKLWSISKERYLEELELCQLLCYDCHKEKTRQEASVEHGGGLSGKRNCICISCKIKKREYMQNRKRNM